ncbi:hypothetical protein SAMN05444159_0511 [Bradyrhizobium lablabi]|uniref:Uncharacterized protein n=1 Tax=Bradyrhizobium lablabi TaxID=722472 RepID=A0A1M6IZI7_9BRAD|nr:hypothetical protein [Bradyrhizobium lablabi]SHJ39813.1 hypothetical protein SAMN05444159_0511 [Bradyrhizobium lablabi]
MTKHRGYYDDDGNEHDYGQDLSDNEHRDDGEHRGREDGNDDASVHRYGTLDANAIDPTHPGQMYFGNGNLATGYEIADNAKEHVEVGLKVHQRGGIGDQTPTFDSHGDPIYTEAAGLQTPTRANWNFDFSADTKLGGGNHTLSQFDFRITVANGTHSETFDLAKDGSHVWISEQNPTHGFGGDDFTHPASPGVVASQAENSVNLAFHAFDDFGSHRLDAGQHYEITLQALEHHEQIAAVHSFVVLA